MAETLDQRIDAFQRCIEARDPAAAEEFLDPGFSLVLVHPAPATMPRARWLEVLPDYVVHSYRRDAHVLDVDGDCGVAVQRAEMSATVLGEDRSGPFVISDVWRLRDGTWRLWRRHSTPRGAGRMPGTTT